MQRKLGSEIEGSSLRSAEDEVGVFVPAASAAYPDRTDGVQPSQGRPEFLVLENAIEFAGESFRSEVATRDRRKRLLERHRLVPDRVLKCAVQVVEDFRDEVPLAISTHRLDRLV